MSGDTILQRYFNGEELNDMIAQYHPAFIYHDSDNVFIVRYVLVILILKNFKAMDYIIQGGSQPLPSIQNSF